MPAEPPPARREIPRRIALVAVVWIMVAAATLLLSGRASLADCRPTFVLVFIPLNWQGDLAAFDAEAAEQARLFVATSGIERYARVEVVTVHEIMQGDPSRDELVFDVAAFGAEREPGDRYIGLTDGDLAPGEDVLGWTFSFYNAIVAETSDPFVTAHELGHTFGLCDEYSYAAWSRQDSDGFPCPNPFPPECPETAHDICRGAALPSGGFCIMGPGDGSSDREFDAACRSALASQFEELFGSACDQPAPTPTPMPTPTPTSAPPAPATPTPGGMATPSPRPTASPPPWPATARIAFESNRDGHFEIYVADGDGAGVVRLTYSVGAAYQPSWSPDGSRIVFTEGAGETLRLAVVYADGSGKRELSGIPGRAFMPDWSPDGAWIAFVGDAAGDHDIYAVRPDGSDLRRITEGPGNDYAPRWSPDGSMLAFYSDRDGNLELYTVSAGGGTPRRLTDDPAADTHPTWSPDGSRLAFASDRSGSMGLWLLPAAGGRAAPIHGPEGPAWRPRWVGRDGWVAYQTRESGVVVLALVHADTGEVRRLTDAGADSAGLAALP